MCADAQGEARKTGAQLPYMCTHLSVGLSGALEHRYRYRYCCFAERVAQLGSLGIPYCTGTLQHMVVSAYSLDAALSLEVARERPAVLGFAFVDLPARPIYTNNWQLEAQRQEEYDTLVARCSAEAAAWNAEAKRWHADRAHTIGERMRVDVEALILGGGGLHNEGEEAPTPEESECGATAGSRRRIALGELDLVDAGLASTALLAELAERQAAVNAAVAQVRAAAAWQLGQEERRRAVSVLSAEQRRAFVAHWKRKVLAAAAAAVHDAGAAGTASVAGEVLHVTARVATPATTEHSQVVQGWWQGSRIHECKAAER